MRYRLGRHEHPAGNTGVQPVAEDRPEDSAPPPPGLAASEGKGGMYAVHVGAVDDRAIVGLLQRFATVRRQYAGRRCFAVLAAERVEARFLNVLKAINRPVPLIVIDAREEEEVVQFACVCGTAGI